MAMCPDCDGPAIFNQGNGKCSSCNGTGDGGWFGAIARAVDITGSTGNSCSNCGGSGVCPTCDGSGVVD